MKLKAPPDPSPSSEAPPSFDDLADLGRRLPPWGEAERVVALFRSEDMREWSAEWPWPAEAREPAEEKREALEAVERAEAGDMSGMTPEVLAALRRLLKPGRGPEDPIHRMWRSPIHRAAGMAPLVQFILQDLYPEQPTGEVYNRALAVIEDIFSGSVTVQKLDNYLRRGKDNRRRMR
jgi:hypothetical protein